jgi:hypothetical protein
MSVALNRRSNDPVPLAFPVGQKVVAITRFGGIIAGSPTITRVSADAFNRLRSIESAIAL